MWEYAHAHILVGSSVVNLFMTVQSSDTNTGASVIYHWGSMTGDSSPLAPHEVEPLTKFIVKQIVSSQKHRLVLTMTGDVYSVSSLSNGDFQAKVSML